METDNLKKLKELENQLTNTEKEAEGLRQKIINIVKMAIQNGNN